VDLSSSVTKNLEPEFHQFVLKNSIDELDSLSDWINQLAQKLELSPRGSFRLELSVVEAVTNVVKYAYEDQAEHVITLSLHSSGTTVQIEIKDDGQSFDPLQYPPIVLPKTLEEAREGGLGIHLIRNYVDELLYRRENQHNIFTLIIHDVG
jgi:sigma-B regulation protein RsbU (phosphoserine phosphatase)